MRRFGYVLTLLVTLTLTATAVFAQDGKLKIKVTPKQAYVFVDGKAIREGRQTISLPPGKHTVTVANYGFKLQSQDVDIQSGKTQNLDVTLQQSGGPVAGPYGAVDFRTNPRAAVLSNGNTPAYFVGHVDEFDYSLDWIWHQNLLLPVGTHHITVTHQGKDIWSGDVKVEAGKKVIVNLSNGTQKTVNWERGNKLKGPLPRFKAGIASATVVVAPVSGSFSASPTDINCGQSSTLTWQSAETAEANISGIGNVDTSGNQSVSPHQTTSYDFTTSGPGGIYKGSGTVNVNTKVDASISANPTDVHYRKIGDKVLTQDSSTLTWQTSNADNVSIDPIGKVQPSGSQTLKAEPKDTSQVPEGQPARNIDETQNYTLNASNVCGGTATQTAALHITGTVEPIPTVTLQSVFFPTAYPEQRDPQVGLVKSQQLVLADTAAGFKKYLEYDPDAKLSIEAYADIRGSRPYNQELTERRVERVKQYLVDQGITADKIQTAAYGKERPMPKDQVAQLEQSNPQQAPRQRQRNKTGTWYAYNRRVDLVLLPSGKKSTQYYPHAADDSGLLWQIPHPPLKKVEADQ